MLKRLWPVIIVLIAGILASRSLLFESGYFNMHDDLQIMRQLQLEKCFQDGQFPCRWVPDMGFKYGFPLFNFYPPLPYLVGQIFRQFGMPFTDTAKTIFAISLITSGFAMYYLAKQFFGKMGGVLSAIFYIWAPYHAVDVYVRGAMNESWALIFFPLIFLFGYKLLTSESKEFNKNIIFLALSWAGLLMSHNLMVMIFAPIFAVWCLLWLWKNQWKKLFVHFRNLAISGSLALGLSAFFTLPAIFENDLTWLKSQLIGYYDYTAHFVTINQLLISRYWGYGPSVWLENDGMPFPAGHIHWVLSIFIGVWLVLKFIKTKNKKKLDINFYILTLMFIVGWMASFMTHVRSTFVYQALPFLGLVQFPWRFLTIVIFSFSFISGAVVYLFEKVSQKRKDLYAAILIIGVIAFNWYYFVPENGKMGPLNDQEKLSGAAWDLQLTAGIYDYLPLTAKMAPREPQKVLAEVMKGKADITEMEQGTDWAKFKIKSNEGSTVRVNIFEFPNWRVRVDGQVVEQYMPEEEMWGRIWIDLSEGEHLVELKFEDTLIRTISNYVSLISWLGLLGFGVLQFKSWKKK